MVFLASKIVGSVFNHCISGMARYEGFLLLKIHLNNIWTSNRFDPLSGVIADESVSTITPKGSRKTPASSPLENEFNKKLRDDISNSPISEPPSQESMETQNLPGGENPNLSIQQCGSNTQSDAVNNENTMNSVTQSDTIERNARDNADDRNSVSSQ